MSDPDGLLRWQEVEAWLALADKDRRAVAVCLGADPPLPSVAAFHCQQAAEKLLKGFLIHAGIAFRKTHDMAELIDLVAPRYPEAAVLAKSTESWTVWNVALRYPSAEGIPEPEPSADELKQASRIVEALAATLWRLAPQQDH